MMLCPWSEALIAVKRSEIKVVVYISPMQVLLPGCELNNRSHLSIDSNLSHFAQTLACILKDEG